MIDALFGKSGGETRRVVVGLRVDPEACVPGVALAGQEPGDYAGPFIILVGNVRVHDQPSVPHGSKHRLTIEPPPTDLCCRIGNHLGWVTMRSRRQRHLDALGPIPGHIESAIADSGLEALDHLVGIGEEQQSRLVSEQLQQTPFLVVGVLKLVTDN